MTPEERWERIEQKIEFIVNQQAQFSADFERSREELREKEATFQKQIDQHEKQINALNAAVTVMVGAMGKLTEAQAKTETNMAEMAEGMRKLEEKGAETEGRLNIFINVVERYISERRNGKPSSES